jgi:hypothetical protein
MSEEPRIDETRHGPKLHLWAGISARGATQIEIFDKNLNARRYVNILRKHKPEMDNLYEDGYWFQQDNHPVHRSKIASNFIERNFEDVVEWPPYSPDLSPIENLWVWLKREVGKDMPRTIEDLRKSIRRNWERVTPEFLQPYFDSLPRRIEELIEAKGSRLNY